MDDGTHMPWHRSSSNRINVASLSWVVHGRVYPACLYHALRRLIVKIEHNQLQKQDLTPTLQREETTISASSPNGMGWI